MSIFAKKVTMKNQSRINILCTLLLAALAFGMVSMCTSHSFDESWKEGKDEVFSPYEKGLQAGADDYITKPYSLPELSLRIKAHIKRNMKSEGFLMEFKPLLINIKTREVTIKDQPVHFTNREFDILRLLAETPNVIVPFSKIYSHVWGDDTPCDNHLVMVNISYMRKKMEKIAPEITFIKTEWGIGYSFAYPPVKNSLPSDFKNN